MLRHYTVHMVSFHNDRDGGYNVITKGGGNLQPWHIPLLEQFVEDMKRKINEPAEDNFEDLC